MQRHPDFRVALGCKFKLARKDADDADAFIVELEGAAKDLLVAAEPPYPGTITEDGDFGSRGEVLANREISAEKRLDAQSREKIDRCLGAKDELRLRAMKREDVTTEAGKRLEGFGLASPIEVIGVGGVPSSRIRFAGLSSWGRTSLRVIRRFACQ